MVFDARAAADGAGWLSVICYHLVYPGKWAAAVARESQRWPPALRSAADGDHVHLRAWLDTRLRADDNKLPVAGELHAALVSRARIDTELLSAWMRRTVFDAADPADRAELERWETGDATIHDTKLVSDANTFAIRAQLRKMLGAHERCGDVVLAASELVTNALHHAPGDVRVRLLQGPSAVTVDVTDGHPLPGPIMRRRRPTSPGGRGLTIVDQLADQWGVTRSDTAKSVWGTFRL